MFSDDGDFLAVSVPFRDDKKISKTLLCLESGALATYLAVKVLNEAQIHRLVLRRDAHEHSVRGGRERVRRSC